MLNEIRTFKLLGALYWQSAREGYLVVIFLNISTSTVQYNQDILLLIPSIFETAKFCITMIFRNFATQRNMPYIIVNQVQKYYRVSKDAGMDEFQWWLLDFLSMELPLRASLKKKNFLLHKMKHSPEKAKIGLSNALKLAKERSRFSYFI